MCALFQELKKIHSSQPKGLHSSKRLQGVPAPKTLLEQRCKDQVSRPPQDFDGCLLTGRFHIPTAVT